MDRVAKLVTFGRGGDTVYLGKGSTISGYGKPENPHAAKGETIPDGTPVIDTRAATETTEGIAWVFKGPMVDPDLPDGACDSCPQPSEVLAGGLTGGFRNMAALHMLSRAKKEKRGPLDHVSVSEYVQGWREHGARIGSYQNGVIVWE